MPTSDEAMRDALESVRNLRREASPSLSSADETWASSEPDMGGEKTSGVTVLVFVGAGLALLWALSK